MIAETTTTWEVPTLWLLLNLAAPLAVGVAGGLFLRQALRGLLVVVVVVLVATVLVVACGMTNAEPVKAIAQHLDQWREAAVTGIRGVLGGSPAPIAAAVSGIAVGLLIREWWRHNEKEVRC
jgi:hypothetical protein